MLRLATRLLAVFGLYVVAGKLGLELASVHPSATAVWPCTGIAIAALLVLGARAWPAIFAGALVVNLTTAGSLASSLGIATGNTLEALIGSLLVRRFARGQDAFDRPGDTFRYAVLVALACVVSATLGVSSLEFTGFASWARSLPIWLTWWLGDLGGALIVAPFLLVWSRGVPAPPTRAQVREGLALLACLTLVGWFVFHRLNPFALGLSLKFLCVPPLMWAAFRFSSRMTTAAVLLTGTIAVWGTLGRVGQSQPWELNVSLLVVQVFLSVMAITTLALAAVVAERQRAANAERAASARLGEAMQQLETFSHAISHDLRDPIGTVINCSSILEEDHGAQIGEGGRGLLRRIETAMESATRLLDQLALHAQDWPRHADRSVVDMTALAREAYEELASLSPESSDIRFELNELPPASGSAVLLERVFRNLLGNAVKFTRGRDFRRITVSGVAGPMENTYLVTDNGIGFDPVDREVLFEPFRRLSGAKDIEGLGVGLAVVARIVRRHGGRVWAESDGSTGSRFGFTLRNDEGVP